MTAALLAAAFVLGLIVGSFLNVVIYRVPRGESVVRPRSACPSCGSPVRPRDNIPVLSWLLLRGRCRDCGTAISPRYPLVEIGTGLAWATTVAWTLAGPGRLGLLPLLLVLVSAGIALAVIDVDHHRLPDAIVLPLYPVTALGLALAGFVDGAWPWVACLLGLGAWLLLIGGLWLATSGRGMGLGDVKLAPILGATLGWVGVAEALVGLLAAFVVGAVVGVGVLLARRRSPVPSGPRPGESAEPATQIAFGPFLLAGAALGLVLGGPVGAAYLAFLGVAS